MDQYILFYPGPVNVSRRIFISANQILPPSEREFMEVLNEIEELLIEIFDLPEDYTIFLLPGSGTAAIEATLSSLLTHDDKLLVINDGVYGEHIINIAKLHKIATIEVTTLWDVPVNYSTIEEIISKDSSIKFIGFVHHETSTGLINYIEEICKIANEYKRVTIIDAISSLGGERFDFQNWRPGAVITSSYACLQSLPGISIIFLKNELLEILLKAKPKSFYLNLGNYYVLKMNKRLPFTLPVQIVTALREALLELNEEGLLKRIERYRYFKDMIKENLLEMGYELFLDESVNSSSSLLTVRIPEGYNFDDI